MEWTMYNFYMITITLLNYTNNIEWYLNLDRGTENLLTSTLPDVKQLCKSPYQSPVKIA